MLYLETITILALHNLAFVPQGSHMALFTNDRKASGSVSWCNKYHFRASKPEGVYCATGCFLGLFFSFKLQISESCFQSLS